MALEALLIGINDALRTIFTLVFSLNHLVLAILLGLIPSLQSLLTSINHTINSLFGNFWLDIYLGTFYISEDCLYSIFWHSQ